MAVEEFDRHTGYMTTGHEWNGIKELNSPVPRIVYFWLIITFFIAATIWLLYPAWPFGTGFTKGLLQIDERRAVTLKVRQGIAAKASWAGRLLTDTWETVQPDTSMMKQVRETGRRIFGENCAACHGLDARGRQGFPNLTTQAWLWGGDVDTMAETIRVGINSSHPDSRSSQMPAFGRDQILSRDEIGSVVAYVRSLSTPGSAKDASSTGQSIFATNCVACHGEAGKGNQDAGAPNLTDNVWIYGETPKDIAETVWGGRQGHMPSWETRLDATDRKNLAFYLMDLRKAKLHD